MKIVNVPLFKSDTLVQALDAPSDDTLKILSEYQQSGINEKMMHLKCRVAKELARVLDALVLYHIFKGNLSVVK